MTTAVAPEQVAKLRRIRELLRYRWDCGLPGCDGKPGHVLPGTKIVHPYKHARAEQLAPRDAGQPWYVWLLLTGRGFGKTRSAAEWVKARMLAEPGHRVALIVPDFAIGRDVCVEGESGLRGAMEGQGVIPWDRIKSWNRSTGELVLTNGSRCQIFSTHTRADAESLRGYQCHSAWFEELGTQRYGDVAWDMLEFALRLGTDPRIVVSTTPRKIGLLRKLVKDPGVTITRGSTLSNRANLPPQTVARLIARYEGTTLGRQELDGELLEDVQGALFTSEQIDEARVAQVPIDPATGEPRPFDRIVVAVDPAGSHNTRSDETGLMVVGAIGADLYVIADSAGQWTPEVWVSRAVALYWSYECDALVFERTYGGDMGAALIRKYDARVRIEEVKATDGKAIRAQSTQMLVEQGRLHMVGTLGRLETEMTTWVPPGQFDWSDENADPVPIPASSWSPNLLDALVWAVTYLLNPRKRRTIRSAGTAEELLKMPDPTASGW